jgi:Ser/Thr protein kinase RdoA (MazF antagonist)
MDKRSRDCFSDEILAEALRCYDVDPAAVEMLGGFESFIYAFSKEGKDYILRLSHSLRYSLEMIEGEVDWINYLARGGVSVSKAVPSTAGRLVEKIDAKEGCFIVTAFEKAPGNPPRREDWENGLMVEIGRLIGRMHRLTKKYSPPSANIRRPDWDIGLDTVAEEHLPAGEERVTRAWHALLAQIRQLPRGMDSYGLAHVDVHGGNFFVDKGHITLFDFGDCQYAWFAYDLAMAFFYAIPHRSQTPEQLAFARRVFEELIAGYSQENQIDPFWLDTIPLFLKLREMDLYIVIHRSYDMENLEKLDPWSASFMQGRKANIENHLPYVDIPFTV